MSDNITLHKSDCALLLGGYQCTCGFHQQNSKTLPALAAEQPKPSEDIKALRRDAERYRWMKQEVKRIPPSWGLIGWDAAIDAAMENKP